MFLDDGVQLQRNYVGWMSLVDERDSFGVLNHSEYLCRGFGHLRELLC
jgi:hypothetical protein